MHAGISAQRLSHFLCGHHHTPLPGLKAEPAAKNQLASRHIGGEETLKTPDKKGPLINTINNNYKKLKGNKHNTYT